MALPVLAFTCHRWKKNDIKASFFFTGNFLRNSNYETLVKKVINSGHYVGPHSDQHLLYCDWEQRDSLKVFNMFECLPPKKYVPKGKIFRD